MANWENKNWIRTFQVTQPLRHKKGFTVYKVNSKMFQRTFPEGATTITVWKRYTDFRKLYSELQLIHSQLHLKGDFPSFPKSRVFGRFEYEVVEERRKSALALLEFAAKHSLLFASKVFVKFFESGYNVNDLKGDCKPEEEDRPDFETCLIPDRLWCDPLLRGDKASTPDDDRDGLSASSFESTPPGTGRNPGGADSDSMISSVVLSCESELLTNGDRISNPHPHNSSNNTTMRPDPESLIVETSSSSVISGEHLRRTMDDDGNGSPSKEKAENNSVMSLPHDSSLSNCHRPISLSTSWTSLSSLENPVLSRPMHKSESSRDLQEGSGSLSGIGIKKPNGYGFFDFLPMFSKKLSTKDRKLSREKLLNESLTASYICEAAGHFAVAQQYESNREFHKAFRSYKEGIRILLAGAKDDKDLKRKRLVKNKLDRYLDRAEFLYENRLTSSPSLSPIKHNANTGAGDSRQSNSASPVSFNSEKVWQNAMAGDTPITDLKTIVNITPSPIQDLKEYKLVKCISDQVYLVVNIKCNMKPKCYAIKILLKSSDPVYPTKPMMIPTPVPFMVKLFQWFETEHSYILVMQYAGGGQLKGFVNLYQTKPVSIGPQPGVINQPSREDEPIEEPDSNTNPDESTSDEESKLTNDMASVLNALAQLGSTEENCESYARLFEEYSETIQDDRTQLATYSKRSSQTLSCEIETGEKEASEILSSTTRPMVSFEDLQSKNFVESTKESQLTSTYSCFLEKREHACDYDPNSSFLEEDAKNFDAAGTQKLIESSKVLLRTVNQTLATIRSNSNSESIPFSNSKSHEINQMNSHTMSTMKQKNVVVNEIESHQGENKLRNTNKGESQFMTGSPWSKLTIAEEEDEGIQSSCEGGDMEHDLFQSHCQRPELEAEVLTKTLELEDLVLNSSSNSNLQSESSGKFTETESEFPVPVMEPEPDNLIPQRMVPECCIKIWAAEIVLALEKLHSCGLGFGDLDMKNVLLGENGHILLSLASQWSGVDQSPEIPCRNCEFLAPEIRNSLGLPKWKIHPSSDFWSLGVILFELITGQTLWTAHPEGFHHSDVALSIPDKNLVGDLISHNGRTLLAELLQYTPSLRLGFYGAAEVKSHPFFEGFDWESALEAACSINE